MSPFSSRQLGRSARRPAAPARAPGGRTLAAGPPEAGARAGSLRARRAPGRRCTGAGEWTQEGKPGEGWQRGVARQQLERARRAPGHDLRAQQPRGALLGPQRAQRLPVRGGRRVRVAGRGLGRRRVALERARLGLQLLHLAQLPPRALAACARGAGPSPRARPLARRALAQLTLSLVN